MTNSIFRAASAAAFTLAIALPLVAQDAPRVTSGTITLSDPAERVQVLYNRRVRLGVVVLTEANPNTDSVGAVLLAITPRGPAFRAGLQVGDIVTRFNGTQVAATVNVRTRGGVSLPGIRLVELAARLSPGDSGTVQYRRGEKLQQTTIVAGDEPSAPWPTVRDDRTVPLMRTPAPTRPQGWSGSIVTTDSFFRFDTVRTYTPRMVQPNGRTMTQFFWFSSPLANVELSPLNPKLGRYFGTSEGVLVINVPEDSKLGLEPGDVVLSVDRREVQSPNVLMRTLMTYDPGQTFTLQIIRLKSRMTVNGMLSEE